MYGSNQTLLITSNQKISATRRRGPPPCPHLSSAVFPQWLQDVIALQCSIMRHLKKQKASPSSVPSPAERGDAKPCASPSDELKPRESLERTPSPDSCSSKPPEDPRLGSLPPCECRAAPCTDCRKPNGPAAEEHRPPKANGPLDCESGSEPCGQQEPELQQRLKPAAAAPATAPSPAPALANHVGAETIKKEPASKTEECARKNLPAAPTIRPPGGAAEQETLKTCKADTPSKGSLEHSPVEMDTSASTPGTHPPHPPTRHPEELLH